MGGYGSGRWYRGNTKTTIDAVHCIDVRYMHRQGYLQPGSWGILVGQQGSQHTGWIQVATAGDHLVLHYRYRAHGGAWEPVEETVWLDWTPCHYGGRRPWFRCPHCQRRVGVLCGAGKWFLCRHCHRLPYASQQQSYHDRMTDQAWKIRTRLGVGGSLFEPLGPWYKPKGMHWRTFAKLTAREEHYYRASLSVLRAWLEKERSFKPSKGQ